jgi:thiol:disulfide interchange protein
MRIRTFGAKSLLGWTLAFQMLGVTAVQAARDPSPHSSAYLISQTPTETGFWVALVIDADKDWHTYWRNPGDSGLPTKIHWELPAGFTAGEIQWPFPERIESPPLVTYGYHGKVLLPIRIQPPKGWTPQVAFHLRAKASWLICQDVCLPAKEDVELKWPNAINETQDEQSAQVAEALGRLAQSPALDAALKLAAVTDGTRLEISASQESINARAARALEFYPYESAWLDHSQPLEQGTALARIRWVRPMRSDAAPISKVEGVVVLHGPGDRATAWEASLDIVKGDIPQLTRAPTESPMQWLWMFLFAFAGGLLLNLMPCVFPVLSIKVMSLLEKARGSAAAARKQGLAYLAGVLLAFWVLSLGLLLLRSTGEKLGWGFQLQSPVFLALLAGLFFLLGFNLLGSFEVGTSWIGLGEGKRRELEGKSPALGSFFTGMLAVIVATPCTAPFMGTAIGFAFSQGPMAVWLIFTGLGVGLAVPFLILAARPHLLSLLPRPGLWMENLKQGLAFPLFATEIWLLWTLVQQAGAGGLAVALFGLWVLGFGIWLQQKLRPQRAGIALGIAVVTSFLILTFGMAGFERTLQSSSTSSEGSGLQWETFSEERLAELKRTRAVFVDFTAAWCLTCQVNERLVLSRPEVAKAFKDANVALLKADWTNRDEVIAKHLESLGRSGVPVYALHVPGEAAPRLLPEVLTVSTVLSEIQKLKSTQGEAP